MERITHVYSKLATNPARKVKHSNGVSNSVEVKYFIKFLKEWTFYKYQNLRNSCKKFLPFSVLPNARIRLSRSRRTADGEGLKGGGERQMS